MGESQAIAKSPFVVTREKLKEDLRTLGVSQGMVVLVHSSLSAIGWVCGGPVTVIQALMEVVTEDGTLVMPTHSGDYSDPAMGQSAGAPGMARNDPKHDAGFRSQSDAFQGNGGHSGMFPHLSRSPSQFPSGGVLCGLGQACPLDRG